MPSDQRPSYWRRRTVTGAKGERACEQCGRLTQEQKPYCLEHLELNTYAGIVLALIAQRKEEDERTTREGHPGARVEAITAQEIVRYLEHGGEKTFLRICRDLCLEKSMAWSYVTRLHIFARVARTRDDRGVWRIRVLVHVEPA